MSPKSKHQTSAMKQQALYSSQALLTGPPQSEHLHQNYALPLGSQTISRSSNLHKHYYQQQQQQLMLQAHNRSSIYQPPYFYYATEAQVQPPPPPPPHTLQRLSYAPGAMSLAARPAAAKNRGPIPLNMVQHQYSGNGQQEQQTSDKQAPIIYQEPTANLLHVERPGRLAANKPLCRCRVMYLGSSVPHITKNGLHGIQEPLRHLYPEEQFVSAGRQKLALASPDVAASPTGAENVVSQTIDISHLSSSLGIDSWLSVWSNGLLLENVDEFGREMKRFYSIESLHYCAAVRFFDTTTLIQATNQAASQADQSTASEQQTNTEKQQQRGVVRFLPLDAPIFQYPGMLDASHPPVFAAIMRRTTGVKVLECHAFICRRDAAANALVRCCTHAYSDFLSAKRLSADFGFIQQQQASAYLGQPTTATSSNGFPMEECALARRAGHHQTLPVLQARRHRSASAGRANKQPQHQQKQKQKHHHHQQQLQQQQQQQQLDNGQYQIIEAIVNQRNQDDPAPAGRRTSSSSSNVATRKQSLHHHHRPANSTGTNSNELTHSEDQNSEESEDDYAIIPKCSVSPSAGQNGGQPVQPAEQQQQQQRNSRDRAARRRARKVKGSSKSLFSNFMPPPLLAPSTVGSNRELDIEKLSHSLDYLAMLSETQPVGADARARLAGHATRSDHDESSIVYSVVSAKSKRHSRSMQDLVQQQQQQPQPQPQQQRRLFRELPDIADNRPHHRHPSSRLTRAGSTSTPSRAARRRASSFQDVLLTSAASRPTRTASHSSFASSTALSRRSSVRSSGRSAQHAITVESQELAGGQSASRIYATCQDEQNARVLGPDNFASSKPGCRPLSSKSSSSKRSRSKQWAHEQQLLSEPMAYYGHYAGPAPAAPPPPPQPPQVYMPAYYPQQLYSNASIYDTITPPPAPFMPLPYVHAQYHHPQLYSLQPQVGPPAMLAQQLASSYAPLPLPPTPLAAHTSGRGRGKTAAATLAARFRCLSPPVNFFNNSSGTVGDEQLQPGPAEVKPEAIDLPAEESPVVSPVLSARPGFMANGGGGEQTAPKAASKSRLSWIKRLSLTLSSERQSAVRATQVAAGVAACNQTAATQLNHIGAERTLGESRGPRVTPPLENGEHVRTDLDETRPPEGADQLIADQRFSGTAGEPTRESAASGQSSSPPPPLPQAETKKAKRKRVGGLFSGALTLGRSSGARQASKIVS